MKQFFKYLFASALGTIVGGFILLFLAVFVLTASLAALGTASKPEPKPVKENSVLRLSLNKEIHEKGSEFDFDMDLPFIGESGRVGLNDLLVSIKKAKVDPKIQGIYLDVTAPLAGMATLKELRDELLDFKASGKWIMTYSEVYSQKGYYLASVADKVYLYPQGALDWKGLSANIMFFKGLFEKLDVEMQVIRGKNNKFKSAVEPFMYKEMSPANREQTTVYVQALWNQVLTDVAASRGMSVTALQEAADNGSGIFAKQALATGLVDGLKFEDEVIAELLEKTGEEEYDDINFVKVKRYKQVKVAEYEEGDRDNRIAVLYAEGGIEDGDSKDDVISSGAMVDAIRAARDDDKVKALVLRVNSPGGSALASDVILRELELTKEKMPVVVSMGDVAASGGYYISTKANKIFAQPNTITGSIGVFGTIPNLEGLLEDKLGLAFDGVKTGKYADLGSLNRGLTDDEYALIQESVEDIYDHFISLVAEGRGMRKSYVDSIGQGRVWSGKDALNLGLVDELGDIDAALAEAAELAGIESYRIKSLPKEEDPFEKILKDFQEDYAYETVAKEKFNIDGKLLNQFRTLQEISKVKGVQARLPYLIDIE